MMRSRFILHLVRICLLSLMLLAGRPVTAQHFLDSLKGILDKARTSRERIFALYDMANYYAFIRIDSSSYYTNQMIQLSDSIGYDYGKFLAYHGIYYAYITQGNYPKAVEIALGNVNRAEHLDVNNNAALGTAYADLALAYRIMQNYDAAMTNARKAVEYFKKAPGESEEEYGSAMSQIGLVKLRTGQLDSVLYYLEKGYELTLRTNTQNKGAILSGAFIGDVYVSLRNFPQAYEYYRLALQQSIYANNLYLLARVLNNISDLQRKLGHTDSCIYYARASLGISQPYHFGDYAMQSYTILWQVYESKRLTDSSFKYLKLTVAIKDSIYGQSRIQQFLLFDFNDKKRQQDIAAAQAAYRERMRIYGLLVAFGILLLLAAILYRNNLQRKRSNRLLSEQKADLETTLGKLKSTQSQLVQAEKMASLGEMTAGIAHEIQNPLNFVNNFAEVNVELAEELIESINQSSIDPLVRENWTRQLSDILRNQEKINQHGKRAEAIVRNMMQHSLSGTRPKEPAEINEIIDEYLKLAYHGIRARDKTFNASLHTDFDRSIPKINISAQDMGRALINLFNNSFYYTSQKKQSVSDESYEPALSVSTKNLGDWIEIRVRDNGPGISSKWINKIFQPFFTTKPTGQGTGLGLSLSYDIITKEHGGSITVESSEGSFTEFIIRLPLA